MSGVDAIGYNYAYPQVKFGNSQGYDYSAQQGYYAAQEDNNSGQGSGIVKGVIGTAVLAGGFLLGAKKGWWCKGLGERLFGKTASSAEKSMEKAGAELENLERNSRENPLSKIVIESKNEVLRLSEKLRYQKLELDKLQKNLEALKAAKANPADIEKVTKQIEAKNKFISEITEEYNKAYDNLLGHLSKDDVGTIQTEIGKFKNQLKNRQADIAYLKVETIEKYIKEEINPLVEKSKKTFEEKLSKIKEKLPADKKEALKDSQDIDAILNALGKDVKAEEKEALINAKAELDWINAEKAEAERNLNALKALGEKDFATKYSEAKNRVGQALGTGNVEKAYETLIGLRKESEALRNLYTDYTTKLREYFELEKALGKKDPAVKEALQKMKEAQKEFNKAGGNQKLDEYTNKINQAYQNIGQNQMKPMGNDYTTAVNNVSEKSKALRSVEVGSDGKKVVKGLEKDLYTAIEGENNVIEALAQENSKLTKAKKELSALKKSPTENASTITEKQESIKKIEENVEELKTKLGEAKKLKADVVNKYDKAVNELVAARVELATKSQVQFDKLIKPEDRVLLDAGIMKGKLAAMNGDVELLTNKINELESIAEAVGKIEKSTSAESNIGWAEWADESLKRQNLTAMNQVSRPGRYLNVEV